MLRRHDFMKSFSAWFVLSCMLSSSGVMAGDFKQGRPAVERGKPGAAVTVRIHGARKVNSGEPVDLQIELLRRSTAGDVEIVLRTSGGLDIVGGSEFRITNLQARKPVLVPVQLIAHGDGLHRLRVFVKEVGAGGRARALSLPIVVGMVDTSRKSEPRVVETAEGERLREVMAAEEVNPDK